MEHDQKRLGLALLPAPEQIDACKNPYDLFHDLVNVAPLGDLITTIPSPSPPPACLLQIPEKNPNPYWFSECWSFNFAGQDENALELKITFPLPVMLNEAQILFSGDKTELPSNVTLEVSDNENGEDDIEMAQAEPFVLLPFHGHPLGAWISIQLKEPRLAWRAVLRIHKPKDCGSVHIFRIRLLEQCDVEMNGEDFNLQNFSKRVVGSKVHVPDMLKYCQSILSNPGSPKSLMERASGILCHFKKQESIKVEVKEEKGLMDMPVVKELLACKEPHPQMDVIKDATQNHDGGLKLMFEQFQLQSQTPSIIAHDTVAAFLCFFHLPRYREILLWTTFSDRTDTIIRLALGVTEGVDEENIKTLNALPYDVLNWLLEMLPPSTTQGRDLRRKMVEEKAIHFILNYLDQLTRDETTGSVSTKKSSNFFTGMFGFGFFSKVWAKGTGYGTGFLSTFYRDNHSSKDVERAQEKNQSKEESVICLLNVLVNFLNDLQDTGAFLAEVNELIKMSTLIDVLSSYLRNESVLDIAGHVPLYRVTLQVLSSIASTPSLWPLFIPNEGEPVIVGLLNQLKNVMTTYSQVLKTSANQDPEFNKLLQDIQTITAQVEWAVTEFLKKVSQKMETENVSQVAPTKTLEERYVEEMRKIQFAFIKIIGDDRTFLVPYHYSLEAHKGGAASGARVHARFKRLAQESVTLSTSLPLSYGSSIFLRCDNDRLDVIKVLITGPAGTPYSNGCFEFDVHFPLDYPNSPPMVNFETTGGRKIRFNPNLYENGKVCLSILNTWHGSPEERWNPKSSALLPVLVAIQSLILVDQPYFNEPGNNFLGTTWWVKRKAQEYNDNIQHCTLHYAILQQLRNPSSCFKEVIQRHFWMKREEILAQCEEWKPNLNQNNQDSFQKQTVTALKWDLMHMNQPEGLEDIKFE